MSLKLRLELTRDHWKLHHLTDRIRVPIRLSL